MTLPTIGFQNNLKIAQAANALYGTVVGATTNSAVLADIATVSANLGVDSSTAFNDVINSYYTYTFTDHNITNASVAASVVANMGVTAASVGSQANVDAVTGYVLGQLNANPGQEGAAISRMLTLWSGLTADPTFGTAATAWNTAITNAQAYTNSGASADVPTASATLGATYTLTTGMENMGGTAGADTYVAHTLNNSNTFQDGDKLDGGAGTDTLSADLAAFTNAITPQTSNIENISIRAQAATTDTTNGNNLNTNPVMIDAQRMSGVNKWETNNSRSDVIIEDVRIGDTQKTKDITIAMVETDPGNVDFGVYFDQFSLRNAGTSTSTLNLQIMDTASVHAGTAPLLNVPYDGFTFYANGTAVTLGGATHAADAAAIGAAQTYAELATALQNAANTTLGAGAVTVSVGSNFTVSDTTSGALVTGQEITITASGAFTITTPAGTSGWSATGVVPANSGLHTNISSGSGSTAELVTSTILLDDVGRGSTGGDLVVGGLSVGNTSTSRGVERFEITVNDNSKLQTINSTNNALKEVTIVNGVTSDVIGDAYTTTGVNAGNLTVNGNVNITASGTGTTQGVGSDTILEGVNNSNSINGYAADHHGAFGFTDVRLIDASTMAGKLAFTAQITSDSIAKYMNLVDTAASPTADVAGSGNVNFNVKGANFAYTGGNNDDTMVVSLDSTVAGSRSTIVSGQSDFTFNFNGGAGNDAITLNVVGANNMPGSPQAWYTNQALNANITIDAGTGNDTIRTPGAGNVIIKAGDGNDTVYTDNSGSQGVTAVAQASSSLAAAAYTAAAAAELAAGQAAAVAAEATSTVTTTAHVNALVALEGVTGTVGSGDAAVLAATATAVTAGVLTAAQKTAIDTIANAVAGVSNAAEVTAMNAITNPLLTTARADDASAKAADYLWATYSVANQDAGRLLDATQLTQINDYMAINAVDPAAPGTATKVAGLSALQTALVAGVADATAVAATATAVANGSLTAGQKVSIDAVTNAVAAVATALEIAQIQLILDPLVAAATAANTAAATALTTATTANTAAVVTAAASAASSPTTGDGVGTSAPGFSFNTYDAIGVTEANMADVLANTAATTLATAHTTAVTKGTNLTALKAAIIVGTADHTAMLATAAAVANGSITVGQQASIDAITNAVAGAATAADVTAIDAIINPLITVNDADVAVKAIKATDAAAIATATGKALTDAQLAAAAGGNTLSVAGTKAVFVFNTSDQTAAYNTATADDRNLADLSSGANNTNNLFNCTLTVTFKGLTSSVTVAGSGYQTTDLQINQAIKNAINNDAVLSKLLSAADGPANTLVVTSLIDGVMTANSMSVTLTAPAVGALSSSDIAGAAAVYNVATTEAAVLAAIDTSVTTFTNRGDYTDRFAETGAAGGNTQIVGAASTSSSDNHVTPGTGDDVIVLGTTVGLDVASSSNDVVIYSEAGFGNDTIVNFAASGLGRDQLDFSALHGRGNVTFNSKVLDNSISVAAQTVANDTAAEIAALYTDSATAINHVYIAYVAATNVANVYTVADAAGAGGITATLVGTIDLADTNWASLTAANFV